MIITKELIVFLWFVLAGTIGGLFFDLLRVLRHNKKSVDLVVYLEDILFWMLLGYGVIWLSFTLDAGAIRGYMLIGMLLGMMIYLLTFSKITYKLLDVVCRYIIRVFEYIINLFRRAEDEEKNTST